jgi:hypothetical protein
MISPVRLFERDLFGKPVPAFPDHAPNRAEQEKGAFEGA